jgi:RNA polymerase sigma factor (sigma-70 family)
VTTGEEDRESVGAEAVRRRILDMVNRDVRLRFALAAEAFTVHLLESGGSLGRRGDDLLAHVRRLSLDDLYLATACARGEEEAWEECAGRHFGFLRNFARRYLREPQAGDVADAVIADLWQRGRIARFDGRSTLRTWLGAVMAHAALNAIKASRRHAPLLSEEHEPSRPWRDVMGASGPADDETRAILRELVTEALDDLANESRLLLLLHYEQGLSLDQMRVVLGGSKSTMSRRLNQVRLQLRAAVDDLARARFRAGVDVLRAGLELGDLGLDLTAFVGTSPDRDGGAPPASNQSRGKTAT